MMWERLQLRREEAPGMGAVQIFGPGKIWGPPAMPLKEESSSIVLGVMAKITVKQTKYMSLTVVDVHKIFF